MHIALDLDDTILDHYELVNRALKTEFGVEFPPEQWQTRDAVTADGRRIWGPELMGHFSDDESWLRDRDWIWALAQPIDGALGALRILRRQGHVLEIVTAKPQWAEWVTQKWLGRWRPPVQKTTIMPLDGKKTEWTDAEILVDDSPRHCTDFVEAGRKAILFDRPHNRDFNFSGPYVGGYYAFDWNDVLELIGDIENANQGLRETAKV